MICGPPTHIWNQMFVYRLDVRPTWLHVCALKEKMSMVTYNTRVRDHRTDAFIQSKLEKTRQEDLRLSLLPEMRLQSAELKMWRPLKTRIEFLISNKSKKNLLRVFISSQQVFKNIYSLKNLYLLWWLMSLSVTQTDFKVNVGNFGNQEGKHLASMWWNKLKGCLCCLWIQVLPHVHVSHVPLCFTLLLQWGSLCHVTNRPLAQNRCAIRSCEFNAGVPVLLLWGSGAVCLGSPFAGRIH